MAGGRPGAALVKLMGRMMGCNKIAPRKVLFYLIVGGVDGMRP